MRSGLGQSNKKHIGIKLYIKEIDYAESAGFYAKFKYC